MTSITLKASFQESVRVLQEFLEDHRHLAVTEAIAGGLVRSFSQGGKVLVCGNGGSCCDAMHFAEEFTGRYRDDRPALPALALADPAHMSCVANDYGFDRVFSRGVEAYGCAGDWLFVLSTSGSSPNLVRAVEAAQEKGMTTVAFLGREGGLLKGRCTHELIVRAFTSDRIQEIHMFVLHTIIEGVEQGLYPSNGEEKEQEKEDPTES